MGQIMADVWKRRYECIKVDLLSLHLRLSRVQDNYSGTG